MAGQGFLARVNGLTKILFGQQTSSGAADANKLVALGPDGKLDTTLLPAGVGANTTVAPATENLVGGNFVNLWDNGGVLSVRLADNSNARPAHGYVKAAVAIAADATVYRLNTVNANLSGLTAGGDYWLGTVGGVINAPLDPAASAGKVCQYLGKADSATELVTVEYEPVYL